MIASAQTFGRRIRLFVLVDALGWRLLENHPFLTDLLPHRLPLRTVLGFSSGAIPTILTGAPPSQTGHWNLFYYDPAGSPFRWMRCIRFLPDRALNNRVARKLMTELGRRLLGLGRNFECCMSPRLLPWFNYCEKRNIYACDGITGAPSIFDRLRDEGTAFRVRSYHEGSDRELLDAACRDIAAGDVSFFFVYLCELDLLLHGHGMGEQEVATRLAWYDARLRALFEAAREVDPSPMLTVFSDHGMTPVRTRFDLVREVESLGLRMPRDYLAIYDSTMARFWFFSERSRGEVVRLLSAVQCGRILADEELRRLGVLFPDRRYGEVIFLLEPGCILSRSDFNGRGWMPVGMHGYHPEDPHSDAVFLTNRRPSRAPTTIADVHEIMVEAMGEVRP